MAINKDTQLITAALSGPNTVVIKKSALSSCMPEASLESLIHYDCAIRFKFRVISLIFFASNCILRVNRAVELSCCSYSILLHVRHLILCFEYLLELIYAVLFTKKIENT